MSNEQTPISDSLPANTEHASPAMIVDFYKDSITVNGVKFMTCPSLAALEAAIGGPPAEIREPKEDQESKMFFWHEHGIRATGSQEVVTRIVFRMSSVWDFSDNPLDVTLFPTGSFAGEWLIAGENVWERGWRFDESAYDRVAAIQNPDFAAIHQTGYSTICRRQGLPCLLFRYDDGIYKRASGGNGGPSLIEFIFPPDNVPKKGLSNINGKRLSVEIDGSSIQINGKMFVCAPSLKEITDAVGCEPRIEAVKTSSCEIDEFESTADHHYLHRRTSWIWDDLGFAAHEITTTRLGKKQKDGSESKDEEICSQKFFDLHLIQGKDVIPPVTVWSTCYPTRETLDGLQFEGCKSLYDADLMMWGGSVDYSTSLRDIEDWKPGFRFQQQKWTEQVYLCPEVSGIRKEYKSYVRYTNGISDSGGDVRGVEICIHCHSFGRVGVVRFCFAPVDPKILATNWGFKVERHESVLAAAVKEKWDSNSLAWVITNERLWLSPHLGSPVEYKLSQIRWVSIECRDGNRPPKQFSPDAIGDNELAIYLHNEMERRIRLPSRHSYQTLDVNVMILESRIAEVLRSSTALQPNKSSNQERVMALTRALPVIADSGDLTIVEGGGNLDASLDSWKRDAIQCVTCGRHLSPLADKCSACDAPVLKRLRSDGDLNWRMKACSNCRKEISRFSEKCQFCGHPNTDLKQQRILASLATMGCFVWLIYDLFTQGGRNFGIALLGLIAAFMWGKAVGIAMWWYGHKSD